MSSEAAPAVPVGPVLHRLFVWFDHEAAAVVTILLGLFQVLLSVPLAYAEQSLPKFYLVPLIIGIIIVAGGSFTMASERTPSIQVLRGCACSNAAGLLGALLAFCLYCYSLSIPRHDMCVPVTSYEWHYPRTGCPGKTLLAYCWSLTVLLLLFDCGAVLMHAALSISAFKALKNPFKLS